MSLLHLMTAFGLSAASGLRATLPLTVIAILAHAGAVTLAPPYDVLGSDTVVVGLLALLVLELIADKVPGLDSAGHKVLFPFSVAAGAVVFASQTTGPVTDAEPSVGLILALLAGGATAGANHAAQTALRPLLHWGFLGPWVSGLEDLVALTLIGAALFAPALLPVLFLLLVVGATCLCVLAIILARRAIGGLRDRLQDLLDHLGLEGWLSELLGARLPRRSVWSNGDQDGDVLLDVDLDDLDAPPPPSRTRPASRNAGGRSEVIRGASTKRTGRTHLAPEEDDLLLAGLDEE